jgi:hypothetical protein
MSVALAASLLLIAAQSSVSADPDPKTIKAQTDIVAAKLCYERGFDFMLRASPEYVICLRSRAGAPDAVAVKQILEQRL